MWVGCMRNTKRTILIFALTLLVVCCSSQMAERYNIVMLHIKMPSVFAYGTPDSYNNTIIWHTVEQWNGTSWVILQNVTTASSWTQTVVDSQPIRFQVKWQLNNTLASDEVEAVSYTKMLMNITGIWTNQEFNNTASSSDATYYFGVELGTWNQTGKPESGLTYNVATRYEAYY